LNKEKPPSKHKETESMMEDISYIYDIDIDDYIDEIDILWQYWVDYQKKKKLEEEMKEIRDKLQKIELKGKREELKSSDIKELEQLIQISQDVKSKAKEMGDNSAIAELNKLLGTIQSFQSRITIHGDYVEGGKTSLSDSVVTRSEIGKEQKKRDESFQICPYCGEELNLPETPNYCPFCRKKLS